MMNKDYSLIILATLLVGLWSAAGMAASEDELKPCHNDVMKFCGDIKPGDGRLAMCLKQHEADLSPDCQASRTKMRDHMTKMHEACKSDMGKYCQDVKPGEGRILNCLKEHENDLALACKEMLIRKK